MGVPFLDLKAHHAPIRKELEMAMAEVMDSSAFAGGPFVEKFDQEFAAYCGTRHSVSVASGTDALWFALLGCGVRPGDEVITVPSTFMATAEAISFCGAIPVFVDIEDQTYTMDPGQLERAITPKTRAIIPVHLFGQTADMDPILEIAARHGIPVVEDACQAHGALYKGRKAGSMGRAGCFSFYPGKNLGALGEGGASVTNERELCETMRTLRDHGQVKKYDHSMIGWNGRMDGIQAAALRVKLAHLDRTNELRRQHAAAYTQLLRNAPGVTTPVEAPGRRHVFHVYALRVPNRNGLGDALTKAGIGWGIHYPIPVHLQRAYAFLGHKRGDFPVTERCADQFISLPMFPELTADQIGTVVSVICDYLNKN